jgi:hypothetical protein
VGIEVKASRGEQSDHQKAFQRALEAAGGVYFLIRIFDRAVEAVESALKRLSELRS